jgi:DNA-binding PadR family transcriptional regulator
MAAKRGRGTGAKGELTTADLVALSLIAEQPMHGYDLLQAYQRQEVEDWTSVSKAQVYYSIDKLASLGLLAGESDASDARGRTTFSVTSSGLAALQAGLGRISWAQSRIAHPFATWVGLSTHAKPEDAKRLVAARRAFLEAELVRETKSLDYIATLDTRRAAKGAAIVRLVIAQIETEISWLDEEFGAGGL